MGRGPTGIVRECGSEAGYEGHRRRGEAIDLLCRLARNAINAKRRRLARAHARGEEEPRTGGRPLAPCGTLAAYARHRRRHEPVDRECQDEKNRVQREHTTRVKQERVKQEAEVRRRQAAEIEAAEALIHRHAPEFGLLHRQQQMIRQQSAHARALAVLRERHRPEYEKLLVRALDEGSGDDGPA